MLNDLTERNMDAWKSMQRGFLDAAGRPQPGGSGSSEPFANRPAGGTTGGSNRPGKKTG
jgi:hypothetical protein